MDINDYAKTYKLPETVCILGSGPNAVETPIGVYTIALNRAAEKPSDMWIVADWMATKRDYFSAIYTNYKGITGFSTQACQLGKVKSDFTFLMFLPNTNSYYEYEKDVDRIGGSVALSALWIAHKLGAKKVIFNGVDMSGHKDFSGQDLPEDHHHGDVWKQRDHLDYGIEFFRKEFNMVITSLSKTKLRSV